VTNVPNTLSMRLSALAAALGVLTLAPAALRAQTAAPSNAAPNAAPNAVAAAPNAAPNAAPAAPARPGLHSWLSDRREFAVGDIITILVDDYTISSAIKDDQATQKRNRDLGLGVDVSTPSGPGKSVNAKINSNNNADSQNRGEARRENRFQSEMSVRVVALGANGTMQVKGTRLVDVDKGQQNVALTGWLRAQDVSTANTVESSRIADAQITYLSPGPLGKPKQGLISRVVSIVWP
jgi:flagellar L-ring protein precursor FlgH